MSSKTLGSKFLLDVDMNGFLNAFTFKFTTINVFALVGSITSFITTYVWDSSQAVYTLVSLMLFNWVLEVYLAVKASYTLRTQKEVLSPKKRIALSKKAFSVRKFVAIIFSVIVAFWMLGVSWNLSKSNPIYYFLPGFVYGGFSGAYVLSLYKNLTEVGFFSKDFLEVLKDKLNINKFVNKSKSEE